MKNISDILSKWGLKKVRLVKDFGVKGRRVVLKLETEIGTVILKGQPADLNEELVLGNISAHEFLGGLHHMAPEIIHRPNGEAFWENKDHFYYLMEFIEGRQALETADDEKLLGEASARLHRLTGYNKKSLFDTGKAVDEARSWFEEYPWKEDFDKILNSLPDFEKLEQCFIHTDIGPHNAIIRDNKAVFIDLDDAGLGCKYIDLGWPFIMQFVDFNKETKEAKYRFDLAKAFLEGYMSVSSLQPEEYNLLWQGAVFMHISYMKTFGPEAEQDLWEILQFGMKQKEKLFAMVYSG